MAGRRGWAETMTYHSSTPAPEICVEQLPDGQRVVTCDGRVVSVPMERSCAVRLAEQLRASLESWVRESVEEG